MMSLFNSGASSNVEDAELRKRGYALCSELGSGSYAKVKSAFSEKLTKKVALKIIDRKKAPRDFQQKFLPRELEVMKQMAHRNVVELYEIMASAEKVYIVMELAAHGDLLEYIKLRGALPEKDCRYFFRQLVDGIEYLHSLNIAHRDLKCENVLLDVNNTLKISDFGFAKVCAAKDLSDTFCGSAAYAAPEVLRGIPYNPATYDIWSIGIILYIMCCGSMPFDDSNMRRMIKEQLSKKLSYSRSKRICHDVKDLIGAILEPDVRIRLKVDGIKNSVWLRDKSSYTPPATPESKNGGSECSGANASSSKQSDDTNQN
ncbi:PREDICTED: testis-specific serine/threonine-protein kinase 1-like [Priapulus caudatus]|uniref:Testis-specific serine/threonine-protein kinase 1-like n=1 Tax=Priapulus caudatus TaxID=37621 RepID=A0ABM1EBS2_PRICU|nr:PREDICTED: testis-specific serine/threonine-protein kinase 1-like [Priapulus caudatus]